MNCPCCSELSYVECCKPYHDGKLVETPLSLMRSRYSAYFMGNVDYIILTTHSQKRPYDLAYWKKELQEYVDHTQFLKLVIHEAKKDWVHFTAYLKQDGKEFPMTEKSRFVKEDGKWTYYSTMPL